MDILDRLRSDMDDAAAEALVMEDSIADACLEILDEFIAGQEVVEVDFDSADPYTTPVDDRIWYASLERQNSQPVRVVTIIVPRTEPPSPRDALLAAAEALDTAVSELADMGNASGAVVAWQNIYTARAALAQAIKRARDRDE